MVDKNELRAAFSGRLHEALNDAGIRLRGRGVDIHNYLKTVGVHKTPQAVSKWLNADAIAEPDSMEALCNWLNVRREWLEYGVAPKNSAVSSGSNHEIGFATTRGVSEHSPCRRVPLLSWEEAASVCSCNSFTHQDFEQWIVCPVDISQRGFAVRVQGDSMNNPGSGRSYPAGCIIFVDPLAEAQTGDRVVARVPDTHQLTFKVFAEDAGRRFLRPLNPQYPIIDITEEVAICGKAVGSFSYE